MYCPSKMHWPVPPLHTSVTDEFAYKSPLPGPTRVVVASTGGSTTSDASVVLEARASSHTCHGVRIRTVAFCAAKSKAACRDVTHGRTLDELRPSTTQLGTATEALCVTRLPNVTSTAGYVMARDPAQYGTSVAASTTTSASTARNIVPSPPSRPITAGCSPTHTQ